MKKVFKHLVIVTGLFFCSIGIIALFSGFSNDQPDTMNDVRYVKAFYPDIDTCHTIIGSFEPAPVEVNYDEGYLVMELTDQDKAALAAMGFTFEIYPDYDLYHGSVAERNQDRGIPGYSCYETVEEAVALCQQYASTYQNLAEYKDIGDSWEKSTGSGYDISVLILTNKNITADKGKILIDGGLHAREYATSGLAAAFAKYLVENYTTDADVKWIIDYSEVHIVFHSNPDGRKRAEQGLSWRKNANNTVCMNSDLRGVDLNRNFSFEWRDSFGTWCTITYPGDSAGSEPETQALENYMRTIFPDQNGNNPTGGVSDNATGVWINLHSYGDVILYPWGYSSTNAVNHNQIKRFSNKMGYYTGYTVKKVNDFAGTANGGSADFGYGELGIMSIAFELGTAFFQDCASFNTIVSKNIPALHYAAKAARRPYKTPAGPDALNVTYTNGVLTATIDDTKISGEPSQNISEARYYIDVPPWVNGANGIPLSPVDGSFNSSIETVSATVANMLPNDRAQHTIFVQGKDAAGNWGALTAVFSGAVVLPTPTATPTATPTMTPTPTVTGTPYYVNIAAGKTVKASSTFAPQFDVVNTVDTDYTSVWGSSDENKPQWIFVDLGSVQQINGIGLHWFDKYFARSYQVHLSTDGVTWNYAATINKKTAGPDKFYGDTACRYVGIYCTTKNSIAYALSEFEIYQRH